MHHVVELFDDKPFSAAGGWSAQTFEDECALINALTMVSHDLRGPLASLSVLIELAETHNSCTGDQEQVGRFLNRAHVVLGALDRMMVDVLQRVRVTGDPLGVLATDLSLGRLAQEVIEHYRPLAESREIAISWVDAGPGFVTGSRQLVCEALDNVLAYSVTCAPSGSAVQVCTATGSSTADVQVSFARTGAAEKELRQALRPFARLATDVGTHPPATELGLWIARLVALRHGGELLASGCDKAMTLTLSLPRVQRPSTQVCVRTAQA